MITLEPGLWLVMGMVVLVVGFMIGYTVGVHTPYGDEIAVDLLRDRVRAKAEYKRALKEADARCREKRGGYDHAGADVLLDRDGRVRELDG
jgi:hypothetical protein